jgi:hypothetical protein
MSFGRYSVYSIAFVRCDVINKKSYKYKLQKQQVTDIIYLAGQKEIFTLMNVIRLE